METIYDLLISMGFEKDSSKLYEALWNRGAQTISELSRNSGIERTKVYRLLPELKEAGLIETDTEYSSDIVHIASTERLQDLLHERQVFLQQAQHALPGIVAKQSRMRLNESRVNVYRGKSGVKQLLWNETKANSEILSILQEPIQSKTNSAFFERWVAKCNDRGLGMRGVVGEDFYTFRDEWYSNHVNERLNNWSGRSVGNDVFSITQNIVIYDDVVAYFNWNEKDIFGVEIHDSAIAQTQRQFFELLWQSAHR